MSIAAEPQLPAPWRIVERRQVGALVDEAALLEDSVDGLETARGDDRAVAVEARAVRGEHVARGRLELVLEGPRPGALHRLEDGLDRHLVPEDSDSHFPSPHSYPEPPEIPLNRS